MQQYYLYSILPVLLFFSIFPLTYTGLTIYQEPEVSFTTLPNYAPNQNITVNVTVKFTSPIANDTNLAILFKDEKDEKPLTQIITALGYTYTSSQGGYTSTNPKEIKTLSFREREAKLIGIEFPAFTSSINNIAFTLNSTNIDANSVSGISLDVKESDSSYDFYFPGEFIEWSEDLNLYSNEDNEISLTTEENNYYCSKFNLPQSTNINISFKLSPKASFNSEAEILIFRADLPQSQSPTKIFTSAIQEEVINSNWYSTKISNIQVIGNTYVCVTGSTKYDIKGKPISTGEAPGYKITPPQIETLPVQPFIKVRTEITGLKEDKEYNFPTESPIDNLKTSVNEKLSACSTNNPSQPCLVKIKVGSNTPGILNVKGLNIVIAGLTLSNFTDIQESPALITKINNEDITNKEITLTIYNITTPFTAGSYPLTIKLGDKEYTTEIKVISDIDVSSLESLIGETKTRINKLNQENIELISALNYNTILTNALNKLQEFENKVNAIESNTSLTLEEKQSKINEINIALDAYIKIIPENIEEKKDIIDVFVASSSDIDELQVPNVEDIFNLQQKAQISIKATLAEITFLSNQKEQNTIIKKTIAVRESLKDIYIYENILKTVAQNISEINFKQQPEIVESDPIVRFFYPQIQEGNPIEITYVIKGDKTQNLYNFKTVLIPKQEQIQKAPTQQPYKCGDKKCTIPYEDEIVCPQDCSKKVEIPWLYIGIAFTIILISIIYLNFYRGKADFRKLLGKTSPFTNPQHLELIRKYIQKSLEANISKNKIAQVLLQKGWSKEQIKYAFEEVEWEKRRVLIETRAPQKGSTIHLDKYIEKCLSLGMDQNRIRNSLLLKGWSQNIVDEALQRNLSKFQKKYKIKPFFAK